MSGVEVLGFIDNDVIKQWGAALFDNDGSHTGHGGEGDSVGGRAFAVEGFHNGPQGGAMAAVE